MELVGDLLRGHTEAIILSLLEKGDSYGYQINSTISEMTHNQFMLTEATLYTAFKRLEAANYIASYWKDGLNQTKRKYYSITALGISYLNQKRQNWIQTEKIINKFLVK